MVKPKTLGEIRVMAQEREDGRITVTVRLIGWEPKYLTSLGHQPTEQARIANRIALEVYDVYGVKEDDHSTYGGKPI